MAYLACKQGSDGTNGEQYSTGWEKLACEAGGDGAVKETGGRDSGERRDLRAGVNCHPTRTSSKMIFRVASVEISPNDPKEITYKVRH